MTNRRPIGIFDSGYGGLTIFKSIVKLLPQFDFVYLGDNARAPYGNRSFETVYEYTLQSVKWLMEKQHCPLVILACNTASAKALRSIQQHDLNAISPENRVLGVIRPTAEVIGNLTKTQHIGILATQGTVSSKSYVLEIKKFFPAVQVHQQACPMWVPFIENNEFDSAAFDYYIQKDIAQLLEQAPAIDTVLLACTHYPLILAKIRAYLPEHITIITQGDLIANSLAAYLERHTALRQLISQHANQSFYTTDDATVFQLQTSIFFGKEVAAQKIHL